MRVPPAAIVAPGRPVELREPCLQRTRGRRRRSLLPMALTRWPDPRVYGAAYGTGDVEGRGAIKAVTTPEARQ